MICCIRKLSLEWLFHYKLIPEATFDENIAGVNVFGSLLDLQGEAYQGREYMQPLQDYYTVEYTRDSDNKIISASYNVDSDEYGTFNSSGELFYDVNANVFYRRYKIFCIFVQ